MKPPRSLEGICPCGKKTKRYNKAHGWVCKGCAYKESNSKHRADHITKNHNFLTWMDYSNGVNLFGGMFKE